MKLHHKTGWKSEVKKLIKQSQLKKNSVYAYKVTYSMSEMRPEWEVLNKYIGPICNI